MTDQTGRGKYSKVIRGLHEAIAAIESVANRALAEKDAEIDRLKKRLEALEAAAPEPTASPGPQGGIDTVVPMREIESEGEGKDRKDCERQFKAAWEKFCSDQARFVEFMEMKRRARRG